MEETFSLSISSPRSILLVLVEHSTGHAICASVLIHNGLYKGTLVHMVPTVQSPKPPNLLHLLSGLIPTQLQSLVLSLFCTKYQFAISQLACPGVGSSVVGLTSVLVGVDVGVFSSGQE